MSTRMMVAVFDGSQNQTKTELATRWAQRLDGTIAGFGVVDESIWTPAPTLANSTVPLPMNQYDNAMIARAKKHVEQSLSQLENYCKQAGVEYQRIQVEGLPHENILVEAQGYDLVLLGKQTTADPGMGVPARTILENLLRHSPRPILVVPDGFDKGQGILVAYDGSLQSARALQALVASGMYGLGEIMALSVDGESQENADTNATRAVEYLAAHGIKAKKQIKVSDQSAGQVIVDEAQRQGAEMIVMGAYGRSQLVEFFLGSTTSKVIDESSVPVFLFH